MNWLRRVSSEPLWKEEFSVHTADERYVTRRQLTKFLVLIPVAGVKLFTYPTNSQSSHGLLRIRGRPIEDGPNQNPDVSHTALPAAVFSGFMFLICLGLYLFVDRMDSEVRRSGPER